MRSSILIDGGCFQIAFKQALGRPPESADCLKFIEKIQQKFDAGNSLLRSYYYDCAPFGDERRAPISEAKVSFKSDPTYQRQNNYLSELKRAPFVSVREGRLRFSHWQQRKPDKRPPLIDSDFKPIFNQKGVDAKIALDVAWLSLDKIVERIYLISRDTDFVPVMKFARRAGVQVFLLPLGPAAHDSLKDNSDCLIEDTIAYLLS